MQRQQQLRGRARAAAGGGVRLRPPGECSLPRPRESWLRVLPLPASRPRPRAWVTPPELPPGGLSSAPARGLAPPPPPREVGLSGFLSRVKGRRPWPRPQRGPGPAPPRAPPPGPAPRLEAARAAAASESRARRGVVLSGRRRGELDAGTVRGGAAQRSAAGAHSRAAPEQKQPPLPPVVESLAEPAMALSMPLNGLKEEEERKEKEEGRKHSKQDMCALPYDGTGV